MAILNFWVKCKNAFISETERDRATLMKFLTHRVCDKSTGDFYQKKIFRPLLAAILNFCVKHKSPIISEMERDRAISTKFLTHRVSAESTADFSQKLFSCTFGGHLEFLCKTQNPVYVGNYVGDFDKIFDTQDICSLLATFRKIYFPTTYGGLLEFQRYLNFYVKHKKNVFISEM